MNVIYSRQRLYGMPRESLFLAGPTPRSTETKSWLHDALATLSYVGFTGTVYVPEDQSGIWNVSANYVDKIEWEEACLDASRCTLFWIPRDLKTLPGFTTNVEFGRRMDSGKIVLGAPPDARKMDYLCYYAKKLGIPTAETLVETVSLALTMISVKNTIERY